MFLDSPKSSAELRRKEYEKAADALRKMISESTEKDPAILLTEDNMSRTLRNAQCDEAVCMQICIFCRESAVLKYISRAESGISMMEYNNILLSAQKSGLDQYTSIAVLNVIIYAVFGSVNAEQRLSLRATEKGFSGIVTSVSQKDEEHLRHIRKIMEDYLRNSSSAFDENSSGTEKDKDELSKALADLDQMASAGIPDALYLKGKCYADGIGTVKDLSAALQYINAACRGGSAEANAMMGDYYFSYYSDLSPFGRHLLDATKAYEHYSSLGAVTLSEQRRDKLRALIEERRLNRKRFAVNLCFFIAVLILNSFMANGFFTDGQSHWIWGTVMIILLTAVFLVATVLFIRKPYNSQRWVVPSFTILSLLCMLFIL